MNDLALKRNDGNDLAFVCAQRAFVSRQSIDNAKDTRYTLCLCSQRTRALTCGTSLMMD